MCNEKGLSRPHEAANGKWPMVLVTVSIPLSGADIFVQVEKGIAK
jgi:hypothetical protein